jgi:hypothetical protein
MGGGLEAPAVALAATLTHTAAAAAAAAAGGAVVFLSSSSSSRGWRQGWRGAWCVVESCAGACVQCSA